MLGFFKLNYTIKQSFRAGAPEVKNTAANNQNISVSELVGSVQKDTDGDGLSDYDELNVYHTSIYLADTDSDGYSDKEEVNSGNDPNCPAGQNCSLPEEGANLPELPNLDISELNAMSDVNAEDLKEVEKLFSGGASVEQIKDILISAGMTAEELSQIPDEEIMKIYLETTQ